MVDWKKATGKIEKVAMDQKLLNEGNKLIDYFMIGRNTGLNLPYHSEWNYTMPVVEKIESLPISSYNKQLGFEEDYKVKGHFWFQRIGKEVDIYANVYYWSKDRQIKNLSDTFTGDTPLESMWLAIVSFIKWYNQQKKHSLT